MEEIPHLAVDIVCCAIFAGLFWLYHIFRMVSRPFDLEKIYGDEMARKRRWGRKRGSRSGYSGGEPLMLVDSPIARAVGVQVLDSEDEETPADAKEKPQTNSMDTILNPSRKYRIRPEA